jgi:methyl-coenzyme M reductase gamma subunit
MDEKWLKAHTTIYNSNGGIAYRDDKEAIEYIQTIHSKRVAYGFKPVE